MSYLYPEKTFYMVKLMPLSICIISLIRLKALTDFAETDAPYRNSLAIILTIVESALGVISACLIVMRPIFGRFFPDRLKLTKKRVRSSEPIISVTRRSKQHEQTTKSPVPIKSFSGGKFVRLDEDSYALPPLDGDQLAAGRDAPHANISTVQHPPREARDVEAQ